ncbi:hypothetical protein SKAU_G00414910 [Synaphobranchus kaupii]|uniref:Uncharacterized protein n=1 Tax=Synaphobranchus kaupii TaxID=118154 RepID=A0A9Q1E746_SYNKA|nr:hypothetical protein SKAU_G00414910 [Synaphobranchus kaupii]
MLGRHQAHLEMVTHHIQTLSSSVADLTIVLRNSAQTITSSDLDHLEEYINECHDRICIMNSKASSTPYSKRQRPDSLSSTVLHREFQALRHSLEFSQEQIDTLAKDNKSLQHSINTLTTQLTSITADNKAMKQTILDLQARSMRNNLVFTSIPKQTADDPEKTVKEFMTKPLKLPMETVNNITFHHVHCLGPKNTINNTTANNRELRTL